MPRLFFNCAYALVEISRQGLRVCLHPRDVEKFFLHQPLIRAYALFVSGIQTSREGNANTPVEKGKKRKKFPYPGICPAGKRTGIPNFFQCLSGIAVKLPEEKGLASEVLRIFSQDRFIPQLWMKNAVGKEISVEPLLTAVDEALNKIK